MLKKLVVESKYLVAPLIFLAARLSLVLSFSHEGIKGYGDLGHFYRLAEMGWPFRDYWVEYPPFFPVLSRVIYLASGRLESRFDILTILILSLAQAGVIAAFQILASRRWGEQDGQRRAWVYSIFSVGLAYTWWSFDVLALLFLILGLIWIMDARQVAAGLAIGLGILTKLFPALALAAAWRFQPPRRAILVTALAMGLTLGLYTALIRYYPENAIASLVSQASKGSWETGWALLDGNYNTGNFGPEMDQLDPAKAAIWRGNPPRISSWAVLPAFLAIGLWLYWRTPSAQMLNAIPFLGIVWCIFLFWSPGWSPQWVVYLLPFTLASLEWRTALASSASLALINLLEWPFFLSRGFFWGLWITVPIRYMVWILLIINFWKAMEDHSCSKAEIKVE